MLAPSNPFKPSKFPAPSPGRPVVPSSYRPQIVRAEEPQNAQMRFLPVGHLVRSCDLAAIARASTAILDEDDEDILTGAERREWMGMGESLIVIMDHSLIPY